MEGIELSSLEKQPIVKHDYSAHEPNLNGHPTSDQDPYPDLTAEQVAFYRFCALLVAWLSVMLLIILAAFSFTASALTGSSAAFGFGFDCLLDIGTSVVVIWRFKGSSGTVYSEEKERRALIVLGFLFIVACCTILIHCIPELANEEVPTDSVWVLIIASVSSVICFGLAFGKFFVAWKLNSQSIKSDGYSSLAGAVTSLSWVVTAFAIQANDKLWFTDDVVGLLVALLLLYYGIRLLMVNIRSSCCYSGESKS